MDDQLELLPLVHIPMRPPRRGFIGECVFASMWEAHMTREVHDDGMDDIPPRAIDAVLPYLPRRATQRDATVAASVVTWLGTNCGRAMIYRAQREVARGNWEARHAYLLSWTIDNARDACVNSGIRLIEYLLAPPELYRMERCIGVLGALSALPNLEPFDGEVIEHVMTWLAGDEGEAFLGACEAEVKRLTDAERLARHAEHLRATARSNGDHHG